MANVNGAIQVSKRDSGEVLSQVRVNEKSIALVYWAISSDWKSFAFAPVQGPIYVWDFGTAKKIATLEGNEKSQRGLSFSPSGMLLASASLQSVKVWDVRRGKLFQEFVLPRQLVNAAAFGADDRVLAVSTTGDRNQICFFDAETGGELLSIPGPKNAISTLAFNNQGTFLAAKNGSEIDVWEITHEKPPAKDGSPEAKGRK